MKFKRLAVVIIMLNLFALTFTGCTTEKNQEVNKVINDANITNGVEDNNKDVKVNIYDLKNIISEAINDHVWYHGEGSQFRNFENKEGEIQIYLQPQNTDKVTILFDKSFDERNEKKGTYFLLDFYKGSRGYNNLVGSTIQRTSYEEIINSLEKGEYVLYEKSTMKFSSFREPSFPPLNDNSRKIINEFNLIIVEELKELDFTGIYKIYITNFKENEYTKTAVIESDEGEIWFATINIEEDYYLGSLRITKSREDEADKYFENQVKKISVYIKEVEL